MEDTATCIFCGSERPTDEDLCPNCGKPWIDQWIEEAGVGTTTAAVQQTAPPPPPPPTMLRRTRPWIVAAVVVIAIITLYGIVFGIALRDTGDSASPTASTIGLASTTSTDPPATTTVAPTTTASTTTTTPFPTIEPVEPAIPLGELELGAFSLGPLEFGDADAQALGRLVASLGQPQDMAPIGEAEGLCPTEEGIEATWGWLIALFRIEGGVEVLAGYRFVEDPEQPNHETNQLTTISGATIGDTLDELRAIYAPSPVTSQSFAGTPGYILSRQNDEQTLLWGFATGADDADTVTTIFAPRACDGGPFVES